MGTTKCRHKQAALGHGQWGQSAAQLFLHIQFEHANQLGNWVGEQSCGGSLAIRGHIQKQFPTWFDGLADGTWNMQMPQIALRLPPMGAHLAKKDRLEWQHACYRQQDGGVIGHQGRACDPCVPLALVELQEGLSDILTAHGPDGLCRCHWCCLCMTSLHVELDAQTLATPLCEA